MNSLLNLLISNSDNKSSDFIFNILKIENFNKNSNSRLRYWFDFVRENYNKIEGDIFEFGVFRGASLISMAILLKKIGSKKKVYGFDSFEGFPRFHKFDKIEVFNKNPELFSELQIKNFKILNEFLNVSVNRKDGFISISSEMSNAEYSAKVAKFSREILQNIIIENKVETARQNLIFSEGLLIEKKKEFDDIYSKLAFFSDSNLNSVNSFVLNEKNKLESEFQIISAVVEEISKQVEQAKLQLKKDTPVFSTIQEAVIPIKRSSPKRTQLVITFGFIGFILSSIFVLINKSLKNIFLEIKNN